jgi:type II secretory pathway pseudopilin PulG
MSATSLFRPGCCRCRRALTLVEAVVSIAIVGVMLVAALNTVGASLATQKKMGDRSRAMLLAQDLMSEVVQQHYEDPALSPGGFGLGVDKIGDGSRGLWDDVDDYDGWSASPPQEKDGTVLTGFEGWRRSVAVDWVDSADVATKLGSDTGVKRITVTVTFKDLPLATLAALRTRTWQYVPEQE